MYRELFDKLRTDYRIRNAFEISYNQMDNIINLWFINSQGIILKNYYKIELDPHIYIQLFDNLGSLERTYSFPRLFDNIGSLERTYTSISNLNYENLFQILLDIRNSII